jgi:hypothetical protein
MSWFAAARMVAARRVRHASAIRSDSLRSSLRQPRPASVGKCKTTLVTFPIMEKHAATLVPPCLDHICFPFSRTVRLPGERSRSNVSKTLDSYPPNKANAPSESRTQAASLAANLHCPLRVALTVHPPASRRMVTVFESSVRRMNKNPVWRSGPRAVPSHSAPPGPTGASSVVVVETSTDTPYVYPCASKSGSPAEQQHIRNKPAIRAAGHRSPADPGTTTTDTQFQICQSQPVPTMPEAPR